MANIKNEKRIKKGVQEIGLDDLENVVGGQGDLVKYVITNDCVPCNNCSSVCPMGAIYINGEKHIINQTLCMGCGQCLAVCPVDAIKVS